MTKQREAAGEVIRRVEAVTGIPVLVTSDPSLKVISTMKAAGASGPAHLLRYNPSAEASVDYLTCFQCGFVLRMAEMDPGDRFQVGSTYRGRKDTEQLLRDHARQPGSTAIPKSIRDTMRDQMFDGLVTQLRSIPLGLRVDDWIRSEFPALADQQRAMALRQLHENLGALAPEIRKFAPRKIFEGNAAMNAAFASYWGRKWDDPIQTSPFRAAGFLAAGEALIAIFDKTSSAPAYDRTLIEAWGDALGMAGWFEFVPHHR